jgi:putative ABC transport system permease protein
MRLFYLRLRSLFVRDRVDAELDEELRFHLQACVDAYLAAGLSPHEAQAAALREMGPIAQSKEECRDMRGMKVIANLSGDLRYAIRTLRRNPGFAAIAVLTLALGIGANTAIFSAVNAVLLRPLPYDHADRLVQIWETHQVLRDIQASYPDYQDWRSQSSVFEELAGYTLEGFQQAILTSGGEPVQLAGSMVTGNLLPMLGVRPVAGRNFTLDEIKPGHDNVVLLSYRVWQQRFGGNVQIVGRQITINGETFRVAGVLPKDRGYPVWADLLFPVSRIGEADLTGRKHHLLETVALLKPGVSLARAQSEVMGISQRLQKAFPVTNKNIGAEVVPLAEQVSGEARTPLLALLAAVGLVMLIACANVANLLLARASARRKEVAIRIALGASRSRLTMQFLTESLLLSVTGSLLGLAMLAMAMPAMRTWLAGFLPRASEINIDPLVLLFTVGVALMTGTVFGLAPAWQSLRRNQERTLRERSQGGGLRAVLVAAEIALAVVVVIGAGLLVRSFSRLLAVDPGFQSDHALTFQLFLPPSRYSSYPSILAFYDKLLPQLRQLPGVMAAESASALPCSGLTQQTRFAVEGMPPEAGAFPVAQFRVVTSGYFQAMRIRLKAGRSFNEVEMGANGPPACLINETMARLYFPGKSAIGRRLVLGLVDPRQTLMPVVGVVADTHERGLAEAVAPQIYFPGLSNPTTVIVRTAGEPTNYTAAVRRSVRGLDAGQPLTQVRSLAEVLQESVARRRFSMMLFTGFAVLALSLAAIGLYGVISWSVARRTQELGVRQALGAGRGDLVGMILREGLWLGSIGVAAGVGLSFAITHALEGLLYRTKPLDAVTFATASAGLLVVSLIACLVPAIRAANTQPVAALRHE